MNKNIKRILNGALGDEKYYKLQKYNRHRVINTNYKKNEHKNKVEYDKKREHFHQIFRTIMFEANISDSFDRTITPINIKNLIRGGADGITCELIFPDGLSVDSIDKVNKALAQKVYGKCMVYIDDQPLKSVRFSAIKKWHDFDYEPVGGLNASQLLLGYTIDLEPVIVDLSKFPHLMITGGSGGGKGKLVEIIMTNLAYNNSAQDLELYYLQLSKDDNWKYELLTHCKGCVTATSLPDKKKNTEMAHRMIKHVYDIMVQRGLTVKTKLGRESEDMNIHVYNKKFKDKLPVIQLWIDEAASTYKKDSNKDINKLLESMAYMISQISSAGRYVGVYLINVMQRASKDELPREIKINSMNWVSFNQVDGGASKVAIGDETSAVGLPQRVFVVKAGGDNIRFAKTPFSSWDSNVDILRSKERVRETSGFELEDELTEVYAEWNEVDSNGTSQVAPNNSHNKLVSKELKVLQTQLDSALGEIQVLKFDVNNKDEVIKELMNKLDCKKPTEDAIKQIAELEYKGAEEQIQKIQEITNCTSQYIQLPINPGLTKKIVKKGEK